MSNSYKEIYNKLIGEKFNTVVIRYSPEKGKYEYRGFSHHAEKNALDNIANLIIDDMIFYAFSENEILRLNDDIDLLEDLRAAAKYAYIERLPKREKAKSDGTMGEVLLDIIIQLASQNTQKLIARAKHTEINNKKEIELTYTEFEILKLLAKHPGIVFSKEQIYDIVWKESYSDDYNIVMSHIRNIREKIEDNPSKPIYIQTVWGVGYRFNKNLIAQKQAIKKRNLSCLFYL